MSGTVHWRAIAIAFVAGLFYVDSGLDTDGSIGMPTIGRTAFADESFARDGDIEYVFTASPDGRRIYMWQRIGAKPPKFVGESAAVLSQ